MKIPKRIASVVINSLKGGVVPRIGLPYITVGRENEINALLHDVEIVESGGSSFRLIVGRYGSGKSFLLQTIRGHVMDRGFVVVDADLSPDRRLQGTRGQGLATYRELIRNMSTKTRPEGGALTLILDRWISNVLQKTEESGISQGSPDFQTAAEKNIRSAVSGLNDMVHGFEFSRLLIMYYRSYLEDDDDTKSRIVKWFRGEYTTKSEARTELGVNLIISDDDWYEYIKLFACFLRQAGYSGLIVLIDELVNLFKITNTVARQNNYEKLLSMYNDTLQGKASYLGIVMSGTPQTLEDTRRGIYSYEALRSRLAEGKFARDGRTDLLAPVIRLQPLSNEEMLVLVEKLAEIHAVLFDYERRITQDELIDFIRIEYGRVGADVNITPREIIRDFIELLNITYQNPELTVSGIMSSDTFAFAKSELDEQVSDDEFAEFEI